MAIAMQMRPRYIIMALGCLSSVALYLLLVAAVPVARVREDMNGAHYTVDGLLDTPGYLDFEYNGFGFFKPETAPDGTSYCWTTDHATFNFPYAANLGQHVEVALRLAANRGPGQPSAQVVVSLNGKEQSTFEAADGYQIYVIPLDARLTPNPYRDPSNVQVDITSNTFSPPNDPRKLGVAVDWIEIRPSRANAQLIVEAAVWALAMLAIMLVATARMGLLYCVVYGVSALFTLGIVQVTYVPRAIPPAVEVALAGLAWVIAALLAPRTRPLWGFGLAACLLWLVFAGRILGDFEVDDAYISYRYAWNFVHGSGLVFNPGEIVEGYTNFLWTVLFALPIALGIYPAGIALTANISLCVGIVALTYALAVRMSGDKMHHFWPLLAAFLLAVDVSLLTFGARGSGMETSLFAFLVLLSIAVLWGIGWRGRAWRVVAGLSLALAALTRPEGLMVAAVLLGARLWQDRAEGSPAGRRLWLSLVPFMAVVVPYQVWRVSFYGYPFPNTFYAKTGTSFALVERGAEYTLTFVREHWLPVALLVVGIVITIGHLAGSRIVRRRGEAETPSASLDPTNTESGLGLRYALALLVVVYTLYIVVVGGDWLVADRFFVPLLGPIVLLGVDAARLALARLPVGLYWRRTGAIALLLALLIYAYDSIKIQDRSGTVALRTESDMVNTEWWSAAGLWLRDNTAPQTLVAAQGAGAIAYYSQRPIIDMLGLNDKHIAHVEVDNLGSGKAGHEKRDAAYVIGRAPAYILVVWPDYFTPVQSQLDSEYTHLDMRNQRGWIVPWLKRR